MRIFPPKNIKKVAEITGPRGNRRISVDESSATTGPATAERTSPAQVPATKNTVKRVSPIIKSPATAMIPDVKRMQEAMADIASHISQYINYDALIQGMQANQATHEGAKTVGKDAFSNFMVDSFLRSAPTKGVEFDPDLEKKVVSEKTPSDLKYMHLVLETLKRIGGASAEFNADGKWGPRTNNGLKNIAAISDALLKIGEAFNFTATSFDKNSETKLNSLIPNNDIDLTDDQRKNNAKEITPLLFDLKKMFVEFRDNVMKSPYHKSYIEGKPFITYQKPGQKDISKDLSDDEEAIHKDINDKRDTSLYLAPRNARYSITFDGISGSLLLSASDLLNKDAFDSWLMKQTPLIQFKQHLTPIDFMERVVKPIFNQVKKQADQELSKYKSNLPRAI